MPDNKGERCAVCASAAVGHQWGGVDQLLLAMTGINIFSAIFLTSLLCATFSAVRLYTETLIESMPNWRTGNSSLNRNDVTS